MPTNSTSMSCTAPTSRAPAPQVSGNGAELCVRTTLLGLQLHAVGLSVGEAWDSLNFHVRDLRDNPERAGAHSEHMAEVALALWDAGIEYIVTDESVDCRHEGWLHVANPDVAAISYPVMDRLDVPMHLALTKMAEDRPIHAAARRASPASIRRRFQDTGAQ